MASNEAGILLMHKDLQKYVGGAAVIGSTTASYSWLLAADFCSDDERSRNITDVQGPAKYVGSSAVIGSAAASYSWLLAADFCSRNERSQNVIDMQGHPDLYRRQGTKVGMIGPASCLRLEVTVTTGKVPVTPAGRSKIGYQAGMCKGMSDVRGYVGGYRRRVYVNTAMVKEKARKSEKYPQQAGMSKGIKSLARYVGDGGRDNRDFLRNSVSNGVGSVALQMRRNSQVPKL